MKKTPPNKSKKSQGQPHERVHVFFSGRVQGVGFRHTTEDFALKLGLLGWVKNLNDGRVELVCEGPKNKIEQLLTEVQESFLGSHIRKSDIRWEKATGEFFDFTVEFIL